MWSCYTLLGSHHPPARGGHCTCVSWRWPSGKVQAHSEVAGQLLGAANSTVFFLQHMMHLSPSPSRSLTLQVTALARHACTSHSPEASSSHSGTRWQSPAVWGRMAMHLHGARTAHHHQGSMQAGMSCCHPHHICRHSRWTVWSKFVSLALIHRINSDAAVLRMAHVCTAACSAGKVPGTLRP